MSTDQSIKDRFSEELKDAMRAKDRPRLDVIRNLQTEVARARSEPGFSGDPSVSGSDLSPPDFQLFDVLPLLFSKVFAQ